MPSRLQELIAACPRLMHGRGPRIPGYVRAGWHGIVMRLCRRIDGVLTDDLAARFHVDQIKEKDGGLKLYFALDPCPDKRVGVIDVPKLPGVGRAGRTDVGVESRSRRPPELDRIRELIEQAQAEAAATCDVCGAPGRYRSGPGSGRCAISMRAS